MSDKKQVGVTLYPEDRDALKMLSDEDRGRLLLALLDIAEGNKVYVPVSDSAKMALAFFSARVQAERKSREHRAAVNRENAGKRWATKSKSSNAAEDG